MSLESTTTEKTAQPQWQAAPRSRSYSSSASVYESILWRLNARQSSNQTMALGITGCQSRSGTSTLATKLALQANMQQAGRVLLIDANLNSPTIKKVLKLQPNAGLYDILSGEIAPRECEPEQIAENVFALASGEYRASEGKRIDRELAIEMMDHFRVEYDLIIVDLPVAYDLRSALPVAKALDGVLLVTRSEAVKEAEVLRAAQQLHQDGVELWGTVLNRHRDYVPGWLKKWF